MYLIDRLAEAIINKAAVNDCRGLAASGVGAGVVGEEGDQWRFPRSAADSKQFCGASNIK